MNDKCLRSDGSGRFIVPEDFHVGEDILIYGKNIHISTCDEYTREFYENLGIP